MVAFSEDLSNQSLLPHTARKGFCCLMSAVRKLSGGQSLTQLEGKARESVRDSLGSISDAMRQTNRRASLSINLNESRKLLQSAQRNNSSQELLANIYFLAGTEYFGLLQVVTKNVEPTLKQAKNWTGFVLLTCTLARPHTRHGVFLKLDLTQLAGLLPTIPFQLCVANHKSAASWGSLFCEFNGWCTRVLH